jgi:uncharacterized protein with HEPN domain
MPPPPRRDPRHHAEDILQAIANIETDTAGLEFEAFAADRRIRQLVERNLEIISEASRRIPNHFKALEPGVPWREIAGMGMSCATTTEKCGLTFCGAFAFTGWRPWKLLSDG